LNKQVQAGQVQQFPALLVSHTWERIIHHSTQASRIDWPESLSRRVRNRSCAISELCISEQKQPRGHRRRESHCKHVIAPRADFTAQRRATVHRVGRRFGLPRQTRRAPTRAPGGHKARARSSRVYVAARRIASQVPVTAGSPEARQLPRDYVSPPTWKTTRSTAYSAARQPDAGYQVSVDCRDARPTDQPVARIFLSPLCKMQNRDKKIEADAERDGRRLTGR
jgi:hypothetical protein